MSYLTFHLVFTLPPIVLLGATQPVPLAGVGGRRARLTLPLICAIAFLYTTPWDHYLIAHGVWWYGPDRVLATVGGIPIEEYLFFLLQPLLTGLFLYRHLARRKPALRPAGRHVNLLGGGLLALLALGGALVLLSGWERGRYLGLILAWAAPVLSGMWFYAGRSLWALRRPLFVSTLIPTFYLWIADATAIHLGIWEIADAYSTGLRPLGLPIEEALFFLVTNLLVVQGALLFLYKKPSRRLPASASPPDLGRTA